MKSTKRQRFGLITFILLIIIAILVTEEPWKKSPMDMQTALTSGKAPLNITIHWRELSTGYPIAQTVDTIHSYEGFDLGYNEKFEQAAWVAYVLTRDEVVSGHVERTDDFRTDTSIHTGSADLKDYRGTGFDRGHLAPAGDMKWSKLAMSESFLLSNMSPQEPSFNRGIWKKLEVQVRHWVLEKDSIYVITGPVLDHIDYTIGDNEVGVPHHYFKVLVDLSPPDHSFIAFLMPNLKSTADLFSFVITVDSLERFTGYDFFAAAPNQPEVDWLEGQLGLEYWN